MCLNEQLSYSTLRGHQHFNRKRRKTTHLVPTTFALLQTRRGKEKYESIQVLLDSGASATVVDACLVKKLRVSTRSKTTWKTAAGAIFLLEVRCR